MKFQKSFGKSFAVFNKWATEVCKIYSAAYRTLDNYSKAIEYYIEELKIEEKRGILGNISAVYINMSAEYNSEHDINRALYYILKADSIVKQNNLSGLALYTNLNIGDIYEKANRLDPALFYAQRCLLLSLQQKNDLITGTAYNNLGNIYVKQKDFTKALNSYEKSIPYLEKMQDENTVSECELRWAKVYKATGKTDSTQYFAKQVFDLATKKNFKAVQWMPALCLCSFTRKKTT